MTADQVAGIFEEFTQAESGTAAKIRWHWTGLIHHQEAGRDDGGTIEVRSEPGVGSTLKCYFPEFYRLTNQAAGMRQPRTKLR